MAGGYGTGCLERNLRSLLEVPLDLGTALLLSLFTCIDFPTLKRPLPRLRQTWLRDVYDEMAPALTDVGQLVGRSMHAQGLIALCNARGHPAFSRSRALVTPGAERHHCELTPHGLPGERARERLPSLSGTRKKIRTPCVLEQQFEGLLGRKSFKASRFAAIDGWDSRASAARQFTKSVSLGELIEAVSSKSYTRVNAKRREPTLPAFSYILRPVRDLRRRRR
jgi:hypothetical protein